MSSAEQSQQAERFRGMHRGPKLLLLPNAWDAMSARVLAAAGFEAVATTSGGVSWSLGYADGEQAPWSEVVAATARIVRAARVPAKAAGMPIVINGRIDLYLRNIGDEASRFDETVARGRAYLAAGADCVYPIGLRDTATMGRLVQALGAPINVNVRAGSPSVAELEALGIARASTASQIALMAMSMTRQIADELRTTGRFDQLAPAMAQADAQRLFTESS